MQNNPGNRKDLETGNKQEPCEQIGKKSTAEIFKKILKEIPNFCYTRIKRFCFCLFNFCVVLVGHDIVADARSPTT